MRSMVLALIASASMLCGQESDRTVPGALIFPPVQPFNELKQHLALTDAQLKQLQDILAQKTKATQAVYEQMRAKQTELDNLLNANSNDSARIGQLTIEIHRLRRQLPLPSDPYRQQALAVLSAEQRTKLGPLDQAMKLSAPAHQAMSLSLIEAPPPGQPRILATDGLLTIEPAPAPVP